MQIVYHPQPPQEGGSGNPLNLSGIKAPADGPARRVFMPFPLGSIYITPGAMAALSNEDITKALDRHARGSWGDLDEHDRLENERAVRNECRLLSAYHTATKVKFWVITEADRATTTILLPEEY